MENLMKLCKEGSFEAMSSLAKQASRDRVSRRNLLNVLDTNLKFKVEPVQALKEGRLPAVPSSDPKDPLNLSYNSLHALMIGMQGNNQKPFDDVIRPILPAAGFWLSLYCERILIPSRGHEFEPDFHRVSMLVLAALTTRGEFVQKLSLDSPKLLAEYAPFLWLNLSPGRLSMSTSDLEYHHAKYVLTILVQTLLDSSFGQSWKGSLIARLEENGGAMADLCIRAVVASSSFQLANPLHELSSMTLVARAIWCLARESPSIHTELLKRNCLRWMCQILRSLMKRRQLTATELNVVIQGFVDVSLYIWLITRLGHSYIFDALGYGLLPCLLKATDRLHRYQRLFQNSPIIEDLRISAEENISELLETVAAHFMYASILKRSSRFISTAERLGRFPERRNRDGITIEGLRGAWIDFERAASYRTELLMNSEYRLCGNAQCPKKTGKEVTTTQFMCCTGCQLELYCSRTCQRADWNPQHHDFCKHIKMARNEGRTLPISRSDRNAVKEFNNVHVDSYKNLTTEWADLKKEYIEKNGEPEDPDWPFVMCLDYENSHRDPQLTIGMLMSYKDEEDFDDLVSKARAGLGTLVYWSICDGAEHTTAKLELFP
ncbi:hypothetical protein EDD85DRAFT_1028206 [Armillaria nabsnona]|nr:hypothetical protein EDD85DRAFT_1028206 [Armillaria nabsnona]